MFLAMRFVVQNNLRQFGNGCPCLNVDCNFAERCLEGVDARRCDPLKCNAVGRTDEDNPTDLVGIIAPGGIGFGGNFARIDIPRVRCD